MIQKIPLLSLSDKHSKKMDGSEKTTMMQKAMQMGKCMMVDGNNFQNELKGLYNTIVLFVWSEIRL